MVFDGMTKKDVKEDVVRAMKLISVITVVFNDRPGLASTRRSLLAQDFIDFEWIIVDGASTDGTLEEIQDSDMSQLGLRILSEPDKGIYDAMNKGIRMAEGEYVVFMNAGDTFYDLDTLKKVANYMAENSGLIDVLFSGALLSFSRSEKKLYRPPRKAEKSIWHGLPANHQATFYRKSLLVGTPYDLQYTLCGDYYLAATLIQRGARSFYLNEPTAVFEVGGASYVNRKQLFLEPYRIQRDILHLPMRSRILSAIKRFISTMAFILLSFPWMRIVTLGKGEGLK